MDNQVEKFDPSKLMDGVRDRIKSTFVSLIPDNEWDNLVQKEIDGFFKEKAIITFKHVEQPANFYNNSKSIKETTMEVTPGGSPFRAIVWQMCYDKCVEVLKEKIKAEYFTNTWIGAQQEITDKFKEVIAEAAPKALVNLVTAISYQTTSDIRNQLINFR